MWKKIRRFDQRFGLSGIRGISLFLGESLYFMIALVGDYGDLEFMAGFASACGIAAEILCLSPCIVIEQGSWKTVYSKISYFPVDRKLYLAAKLVPGAAAAAGHMGITWLAFLAMALMKRPLAMEGMLLLTLSLAVSGVWFLAGFLVAMALAGEEESKFPGWGALLFLAFESGISLAYVICR